MAEAKLGLLLSSSGVFKKFETRQQKKNWRKLESQAGKCTRTKPKLGVKIRLIRRFRELCNPLICLKTLRSVAKNQARLGNLKQSFFISFRPKIRLYLKIIFSCLPAKTNVVGAQKNRFNEMVLLGNENKCHN